MITGWMEHGIGQTATVEQQPGGGQAESRWQMSQEHLATYLNDHLAGSVVALEMLAHLQKAPAGRLVQQFVADLHAAIAADRHELEALMGRFQVTISMPRQAAAWLGEKMSEIKLRLDDPANGPLHLLEALEAVAIGIEGKRALWRSLAAAADDNPRLRGTDYGRLEQRADEQRRRVEPVRLEAARAALGGNS